LVNLDQFLGRRDGPFSPLKQSEDYDIFEHRGVPGGSNPPAGNYIFDKSNIYSALKVKVTLKPQQRQYVLPCFHFTIFMIHFKGYS
jgi:hypothetical protein